MMTMMMTMMMMVMMVMREKLVDRKPQTTSEGGCGRGRKGP